jgi:ubiquitin C-terminal hydrolase
LQSPSVSNNVKEELLDVVMNSLLTMTEEQAKKENSDSVASLIRYIGVAFCEDFEKPEQIVKAAAFHQFWMKYAFRAVQSGSLVLKLFGWDQVNELVREAICTRPPVDAYEVVGAGTDYVNGKYVYSVTETDGSRRYVKPSQSDDVPTLTLYRCVMKGNKGRYWFITNLTKDVDFYQHQSQPYQDKEPQSQGWICVSYNNTPQAGKYPAPVLRRIGPSVVPEGVDEKMYLFQTLCDWVLQNDLLSHVFRSSPHREIIARSSALVCLLAEANRLNASHLSLIWKTAIQSHDVDAIEEIFSLLVTTCAYLSEDMYTVVIDFAMELMDSSSSNSNIAENYSKVALFAEKFSKDSLHDVGKLSPPSAAKLIFFVWSVYKNPLFETLKSTVGIQEFLISCLSLPAGKAIAHQSIKDCLSLLPTAVAEGCPQSDAVITQRETSAARAISALNFLLCKDICASMCLSLEEEGVSTRIVEEIKRFIKQNRPRYSAKAVDMQWYSSELNHRFTCIRQYYGLNVCVKMSLEVADLLWHLVRDVPLEIECLFVVFSSGAMTRGNYLAIADYAQFIEIFNLYICSEYVDWSQVGEKAFECFDIYFRGLQSPGAIRSLQCSPKELPPFIGMDTLWNIVFNMQHVESQRSAVTHLIKSYEELLNDDRDEHLNMVQRIFLQLKMLSDSLDSVADKEEVNCKMSRCVDVLHTVVMKSRAPVLPIHALQGCMQRTRVTVMFRKVTTMFNYNSQMNSLRTEKGSEITVTVETHPLHSVRAFKKKLSRLLGLPTNSANVMVNNAGSLKIQFEGDLKQAADSDRLCDYGVTDGAVVSAYSYATFGGVTRHGQYNNSYDADSVGNDGAFDLDDNELGLPSIGQAISGDPVLFQMLLDLCDSTVHPHLKSEVIDKIWALLMTIPSQDGLVNEVISAAVSIAVNHDIAEVNKTSTEPTTSPQNWTFLYEGSLPRRTYLLQIVDHLLQPSSDSTVDNSTVAEFSMHFLNYGGFTAVMDLFTSVDPTDKRRACGEVARVTLSVALHLIHHILFDLSTYKGSGNHSRSNSLGSSRGVSPAVIAIDIDEIQLVDTSAVSQQSAIDNLKADPDPKLMAVLHSNSAQVIEKLLNVASSAASSNHETLVVRDALMILTLLLRSDDAAAQLINNPASKSLLLTVLRSPGSDTVREMAAEFAIQVGKSQPVVFSWLLTDFKELKIDDYLCSDLCRAMAVLMNYLHQHDSEAFEWLTFAKFLSERIFYFGSLASNSQFMEQVFGGNIVILGHLQLLERLIRLNPDSLVAAGVQYKDIATVLVNTYMFPLPQDGNGDDLGPICTTTSLKKAGFQVLSALISLNADVYHFVIGSLTNLSSSASSKLGEDWSIQISSDIKRADIPFTGLKNQGCTCYSNSLLQQLFMNVAFRDAILKTPLKECHRHTVSHMTSDELVGCHVLMEWENVAKWRPAIVLSFDEGLNEHTIEYMDGEKEQVSLTLDEGRYKKETGYVRVAPDPSDVDAASVTDRELGAYRVLEQLQRTFCFLKYSKRRYLDPRPLVEVCKVLNLNFSVFQQNDASEYCDQLLDRIEQATKGKHTGVDIWGTEVMTNVFGGKTLTQKIPQQCEFYETDKKTCGHWQSSRQESFLKIELIIRGKDNIHDSIAELVAGELMDGDNKIQCDVCMEKKATFRRTCFDILPNTMIVHLKRFDLDFSTFETVKLNNRLAFDAKINMLKYTKEGIEAEERKLARESAAAAANNENGVGGTVKYENSDDIVEPDPLDYEYQLQGVLVHSGIAQGGHYYSFIKDPASTNNEKWYKFDDDEVSPFNPDQIPYQCFGGPQPNSHGGSSNFDNEDRSANALMLFYTKLRPTKTADDTLPTVTPNTSPTKQPAPTVGGTQERPIGSRLVNGYQAFYRELRGWNLEHLLSRYVLDADLHVFVREVFESVIESQRSLKGEPGGDVNGSNISHSFGESLQWYAEEQAATVPLQLIQFGCNFLFDVVLKCRERSATKSWVSALKSMFAHFPSAALWFLQINMNRRCCLWFKMYLLSCTDALARNTYVQVLAAAVHTVAATFDSIVSGDKNVLLQFERLKHSELLQLAMTEVGLDGTGVSPFNDASMAVVVPQALLYLFTTELMQVVLQTPSHPKVADDVFNLMREVCTIPCVCSTLLHKRAVTYLAAVALSDSAPDRIRAEFDRNSKKQDTTQLHASIFEALAALLGVPQLRKVQLVTEVSQYEYELLPEAREAFTAIFNEVAKPGLTSAGLSMDAANIVEYKERIGVKVSLQQARVSLSRFQTNTEGRLTLEGFLQYYCDLASYSPKDVWKVIF